MDSKINNKGVAIQIMDKKETQLVNDYHKKIIEYNFDERDIHSFLMLLREHTTKNTPVREFGDFIAHRNKERGLIRDYLLENKKKIDNIWNGSVPNEGFTINSNNVFELIQIKRSFNNFLELNNLKTFDSELIRDVVLCIMSLLQDVNIYDEHKNVIGNLSISASAKKIILIGSVKIATTGVSAAFPVLEIKNKYVQLEKVDDYDSPRNLVDEKFIEVINNNKKIEILIREKV